MIVMKFGGAALGTPEAVARASDIISTRLERKPVIVLSAMAKTTRSILSCAREFAAGRRKQGQKHIEPIRTFHYDMADALLSGQREAAVRKGIDTIFEQMNTSLEAFFALHDLSARSADSVLCFGELLSTLIIEQYLQHQGISSRLFDSRSIIVTDSSYTRARPLMKETAERIRRHILPAVNDGDVPVFQGFIGATPDGVYTTLGFEGSDYTAAIAGGALHAECIEIWKNVPGIMTADPNVVKNAYTVPALSFDQASELTFFGAKVLHPSTMRPARENGIHMAIYNTMDPQGPHTVLLPGQEDIGDYASITSMTDIAMLRLNVKEASDAYRISAGLEMHGMVVYITEIIHETFQAFVSDDEAASLCMQEEEYCENARWKQGLALVTVVGAGPHWNESAVYSQVCRCLANETVPVYSAVMKQCSCTVCVDAENAEKSVRALHASMLSPVP